MDDPNSVNASVDIIIHGQRYPITANSDEEYIRKVAKYVDERMSQLKDKTSGHSLIRLAVLAALNITDELFTLRKERNSLVEKLEERTKALSLSLDKVLVE